MRHLYLRNRPWDWACACLSTLLFAPLPASAGDGDILFAVQVLREGGCGGLVAATQPPHHEAALDRAAAQWAGGIALAAAAHGNGYAADTLSGLHVTSDDPSLVQLLRRSCRTITDRRWRDLGVYHRGLETWLILASRHAALPATTAGTAKTADGQATAFASPPFSAALHGSPPPVAASAAPAFAASSLAAPVRAPSASAASSAVRVLNLVNDIRGQGTQCSDRSFGPAPPVRLSGILNEAALGHAADMARHDYFEHEDLSGRSPAQRVRAVGYAEKLVGENIAYGPLSADEVVRGWLDSPGHCENIMDPRFAEMGIASASGQVSRRGLYWVQLLVAPKT